MENNSLKPSPSNSKILPDRLNIDSPNLRVLIIDAQNSICRELQILLKPETRLKVVGTATNGASAINLIESLQPDIVLLDLEISVIDGFETIEIIVKRFPECKILVLSSSDNKDDINRAVKAGARGYLLKSTPAEEMANAILSAGKSYFQLSPGLFTKIFLPQLNAYSVESQENSALVAIPSSQKSDTALSQEENKLFRQKSLERLSSPERLDQLMRVVNPKSWIPLATLGVLGMTALTWSILGRIPVTVQGAGVFIHPSTVVPLQSKSSGQLIDLRVKNGDIVQKGDVIATIDQSDRDRQLQLAQNKLAQIRSQNLAAKVAQGQRKKLDGQAIREQRQTLEQRLKIIQDLTPSLKDKGLISIQRQRQTLNKRRRTLQELYPTFKERLDKRRLLFEEGAISEDVLLQARQEFLDNTSNLDQVESQLAELEVKEANSLQQYLSNLNEVKNIQAQLQELNSKQANLNQQDLELTTTPVKVSICTSKRP